MLAEVFVAVALAIAGTAVLVLWIDLRCVLDVQGIVTLATLIAATVAAASVALRVTALAFPMGSIPAVLIALGGWTLVVAVTTRPRPALSSSPDRGEGRRGAG